MKGSSELIQDGSVDWDNSLLIARLRTRENRRVSDTPRELYDRASRPNHLNFPGHKSAAAILLLRVFLPGFRQ